MHLSYVEMVHSVFQVYYILWLFCIFILLIFESLILKLQLKILIFLVKKVIVIDSITKESTCNSGDQVGSLGQEDPLKKGMATHSSNLAWRIPWMEEPGRLQSMGSLWVRHDWVTSLSLFTFTHWRRKWQLTPVFLPGESQGRGSLVCCPLWGRTESDMTEAT